MCLAEADVVEDADRNVFIKEPSETSLQLVDGRTSAQLNRISPVEQPVEDNSCEAAGDPDSVTPQPDMSERTQDAGDASPGVDQSRLDELSGNDPGTGTPLSHDGGLMVEPNKEESSSPLGVSPQSGDVYIN